jgi:hypothetical protein
MERFAEIEVVRLDRIEKRARKYFERAAHYSNAHRMLRAAKLEAAAHTKALKIVAAEVLPFDSCI